MQSVWDMILQWGSTIKVSTELPATTRHRSDMTEKLLKAMLNPNTHTHKLTYIYFIRSVFVTQWSIIPSIKFIHQIVFNIIWKITCPWNTGHSDVHLMTQKSTFWLSLMCRRDQHIRKSSLTFFKVSQILTSTLGHEPWGRKLWKVSRPFQLAMSQLWMLSDM